ncbi:MAG: hypothetical protein JNN11_02250 [Candidatus Doudnabacteria bacterium]|nr:hypothetical protein [Candidatus Doudnabacteria bacterium]
MNEEEFNHFNPYEGKKESGLTPDEKDLVASELFAELLASLKGTQARDQLAEFMIPELDEDTPEQDVTPNLERLKEFLVNNGVVTGRELEEIVERIIIKLPDLKLSQEANIATWQPRVQNFLADELRKFNTNNSDTE